MLERTTGIEPASSAWEADVLPMNYVREERLLLYVIFVYVTRLKFNLTYEAGDCYGKQSLSYG